MGKPKVATLVERASALTREAHEAIARQKRCQEAAETAVENAAIASAAAHTAIHAADTMVEAVVNATHDSDVIVAGGVDYTFKSYCHYAMRWVGLAPAQVFQVPSDGEATCTPEKT